MSFEQTNVQWFTLIRSKKRLDREKGVNKLKEILNSSVLRVEYDDLVEKQLVDIILSLSAPWEERHGGLLAAGVIIQNKAASKQFCESIKAGIPLFLEDSESRIRIAAGEIILFLNEVTSVRCKIGV